MAGPQSFPGDHLPSPPRPERRLGYAARCAPWLPEPPTPMQRPPATLLALCASTALWAACGAESPASAKHQAPPAAGASAASPAAEHLTFDEQAAWSHLERIVGFGPRPAGSASLERLRSWLEDELSAMGLEPHREAFEKDTPIGKLTFSNLWVELPGRSPRTVLLGSHMDTKRLPFPFLGANDGGSSTALLLELARTLAAGAPHAVGYRLVWFDGEESIRPEWSDPDALYGSRHHAAGLRASGELERIGAMVLFDLVGDRDLQLERDANSHPELVRLFLRTAAELGQPELFSRFGREILDDHLPFRDAGVPVIDLIDLDYGPGNSYWHEPEDVLANCSAESLGRTAALFLEARAPLEAWVLAQRP